jgi:hypothetical protein
MVPGTIKVGGWGVLRAVLMLVEQMEVSSRPAVGVGAIEGRGKVAV